MWITLLLIARVACEWVEISQHHYRKPGRTHQITKVYPNQTIAPHTWTDRNVHNKFGTNIDRNTFIHHLTSDDEKKEFVGVKRVSSAGIIKRVQLSNTPVKSPPGMGTTSASDQFYTNFDVTLEDEPEELHRRFYNKRKPQANIEINEFNSGVTLKNYSLVDDDKINHFVTLNTKTIDEDNNNFRSKGKINNTNFNVHEDEITKTATEPTTKREESNKAPTKQNFVTTENTIINHEYIKHVGVYNNENNWKLGPDIKQDKVSSDGFINEKENNEDDTTDQIPTMDSKANKMEFLMKLMKTVADIISQNSHKSLRSKMRYLHELKNTMLENIENRINALWPDDETDPQKGGERRARSAHQSARGHVEFPSSESTLMTISFLTFAVFLIKLVLQVIQTYKNKTMMVAPVVVATAGRAVVRALQNNDKKSN